MAHLSKLPRRDGDDPLDAPVQAAGAIWALVLMLGVFLLAHDYHRHGTRTGRYECTTNPRDFLQAGEMLERGTLLFIIDAHCRSASYRTDGWIELRYEGATFGVETSQFNISQTSYFEIMWVGGMSEQ